MSVTVNPQARPATMSGRAASQLCGLSQYKLLKMASLGRVRIVAEPGSHVRFHTEDVNALAVEQGRTVSPN